MMLFLLAQAKCHWEMAPITFMAPQLLVCNLLGSPCLVIWTLPVLNVGAIEKALRQHLGGTHDYALHCPRAAPFVGVVKCTYHH